MLHSTWTGRHPGADETHIRRNQQLTQIEEVRNIVGLPLVSPKTHAVFLLTIFLTVNETVVWASIIISGRLRNPMVVA